MYVLGLLNYPINNLVFRSFFSVVLRGKHYFQNVSLKFINVTAVVTFCHSEIITRENKGRHPKLSILAVEEPMLLRHIDRLRDVYVYIICKNI